MPVPPPKFAAVEDGIYRSGMPRAANIAHLETLRLKTVLLLSSEPFELPVSDFFKSKGIRVEPIGKDSWQPTTTWPGVSEDMIKRALQRLFDERSYPMLVCCATGIHMTGVLISCLRRAQRWAVSIILEEYRAFAEPHHRTSDMHFIEQFDIDIVNIESRPPWYEAQVKAEEEDLRKLAERVSHGPAYQEYNLRTHASVSIILEEYRAFAEPHHRTSDMHFIEQFDIDIVNIESRPPWYEAQVKAEEEDLRKLAERVSHGSPMTTNKGEKPQKERLAMSRKNFMFRFIGCRIKCEVQHGRILCGTFGAFDRSMNIVLFDTEEQRTIRHKKGKKETLERRHLGCVLLRGDAVITLMMDGQEATAPAHSERFAMSDEATAQISATVAAPAPTAAPRGLAAPARGVGAPDPTAMAPAMRSTRSSHT
ncbi:putative tyrosine-protein phosphatase [Diplonema papillatum]|nr:putative tyrosine-protein phosphatase [Diplonema papillatum]